MFESVATAPPDAILGITEAFLRDSNPHKINLSVGVYKDASGKTPVLPPVKEAERRILETEQTKSYKPIPGAPEYGERVRELLFGSSSDLAQGGRAVTVHAPGGTGALRVAADYLARLHPGAAVWQSKPTWANHPAVFGAAGLEVKSYPYFDATENRLDFEAMLAAVKEIPSGNVLLLHGCCHNPSGVDPSPEQWRELAAVIAARGILPLIDFAYQGFATGIEEDAGGVRIIAEAVPEVMVASSFSKNFGLYCERVGALTVVADTPAAAAAVFSQLKVTVRTNYSNPPSHGGAIVATVLGDPALRQQWEGEVTAMRERIRGVRTLFVKTLGEKGVPGDWSFIERQNGMFSFSGLSKEQVEKLRDEHSVYIVGSGRINVAGMTPDNVGRLCEAIGTVV